MLYRFKDFVPEIHQTAFIAPSAVIIGQVRVEQSASVWFNTVARGDINSISIGANSNIQDNCVLHVTDQEKVIVEERVTVGHGVILHGCSIGADCLIGMGTVILDGAIIGENSIIAAGAVVAPGSNIPQGSLVMGVPGKVVRPVKEEERRRFTQNWQNYLTYAKEYLDRNVFQLLS